MARSQRGVRFSPVSASEQLHQHGKNLQEANRLEEARAAYQQSLALSQQPALKTLANLIALEINSDQLDLGEHWLQLGLAQLARLGAVSEANVEGVSLLLNSGLQLKLQRQQFSLALQLGQWLMQLQPTANATTNLAVSLMWSGHQQAAVRAQTMGLKLNNAAQAKHLLWKDTGDANERALLHIKLMNLATYWLALRPLSADGWQLLESRLATRTINNHSSCSAVPWEGLWDGSATSDLVIWDEQGYGDCLQCLRWIELASQRCEHVRLMLRPPLLRLVRERLPLPAHCEVHTLDGQTMPWQQGVPHIPVMALPRRLHQGDVPRPSGQPYLTRRAKQRANNKQLRLGLTWAAGTKDNAAARRAARLRSMPVELLNDWLDHHPLREQLEIVNLQHPEHPDYRRDIGEAALQRDGDWCATAAVLDQLDAVISVDTAMVHLGGAMGIPTLILLNHACDWRWSQQGSQTFWYESCTLARCRALNDWTSSLQQADHWLKTLLP